MPFIPSVIRLSTLILLGVLLQGCAAGIMFGDDDLNCEQQRSQPGCDS